MANLKTNNLCGQGGRRAYRGSVFFDGRDDVTTLQVIQLGGNNDFTFGTGDFTIEMWINHGETRSFEILYDGRRDGSNDVAPMIYLVSGVVYYYTAGGNRITGSSTLSLNSWHHIALERSSGSTKLYVNGIQEGSTYSDSNSYVAKHNRPTIGGEGVDFANNPFNGFISNVRVCKGHAVYGANFTPPTSELVTHYNTDDDKTVLLCCQDSDNPLQEATGKELLGQGGVYFGKRFSNLATNGDLETGATTNWNNSGCATFEVSNFSHSGSYSIHALTNSNGDAISYTIPVQLDTQKRYKISAYIYVAGPLGTTARAKMKIGAGTGGNENYESEVVGAGNNGLGNWKYVEWIGLATSDTTHVTFNESSANNANDYYVDDLRIELWYPEEGVNILANPRFTSNSTGAATGWSFTSTPSGEFTIANNKLSVADTSRTNDAIATQQLFSSSIKEGRYLLTLDYSVSSGDFDVGIGNNRLFGIANTHNGGAGSADTFTTFLDAGNGNSLFRIVCNQHCVAEFFSVHLSRVPEPKAPKNIPPSGVDAGNIFEGATAVNSTAYMNFPTGKTDERGRGRGLIIANYVQPSNYNTSEFITIQSMGNSQDFGDTSQAVRGHFAFASSTRAVSGLGYVAPANTNVLEFFTIATQSNATDFGDITNQSHLGGYTPISNETRGIFAGGYSYPATFNNIDYVTIASTGNSVDFGGMTTLRADGNRSAVNSSTRGIIAGGYISPAGTDNIEYVTIATTGNSQDFGDLTQGRGNFTGVCSSTRGVFAGGTNPPNSTIDYVTMASTGNATDFGDMITGNTGASCSTSNQTRGVIMGGDLQPADNFTNVMQYVTIATTGDSLDFGDMLTVGAYRNSTSDSHGGLS